MTKKSEKVKRWREKTKKIIVESMGGACAICGYNKCNRALDLHHIDPLTKEVSFGQIMANPKRWDIITNELKKCVLLCSRCHMEVHDGLTDIPLHAKKFNCEYEKYREVRTKSKDNCPVCGNEKWEHQKTCSKSCAASLSKKTNWNDEKLYEMINSKKMTLEEIGEEFGVTIGSVVKRAKKIGIII